MTIKAWRRTHTWSSLGCTAFLLISSVTGLPLIFHDEIDNWLRPPAAASKDAHTGAPLGVDAILEKAAEHSPDAYVQFVFWDDEQPDLVGVGMAARPDADLADVRRLLFDRWTGLLAEQRPPESAALTWLIDLHSTLLAGGLGSLVMGCVAVGFLASLISGVVLYGPSMKRLDFGGIRVTRAPRIAWLDLHNLVGIAIAAWMIVVAATGFINTFEGPLFALAQGGQMDMLLAPYAGKPYPETLSSPEAAVEKARQAFPGMQPTSEGFPYSRFGGPRHYLIWLKGSTPITSRLFNTVLVDAASGEVVAATTLPWYIRSVELSRPLHFGDYGGFPLKVLWAIFDLAAIAVLLTGLRLWWRGARNRGSDRLQAASYDAV